MEDHQSPRANYISMKSYRSRRRIGRDNSKAKACTVFDVDEGEYDVGELVLKANSPPDHSGASLDEIMKRVNAWKYYKRQFQNIQEQTGINPRTLCFSKEYETGFHEYLQKHSVNRVRYCLILGFFALGGYFIAQSMDGDFKVEGKEHNETILNVLCFGICLPSLFLGILMTFIKGAVKHMEKITMIIFLLVGCTLIAKKPLREEKGPVLPLFLLLIPIFGTTRMRFVASSFVGWSLFFTYLVVQLIYSDETDKDRQGIVFQGVNYAIGVIGGSVSHYRQELLRRRNYSLMLPFNGIQEDEDQVSKELQEKKFSKRALMHKWSRSFRNTEVEELFYRYWYLIDPFPYEHSNAGTLHQGVFRVLRFAVIGLCFNQAVLSIQDSKFLSEHSSAHIISAILRYGVVIPAYLSAAVFLYFLGKAFFKLWVQDAEARNKSLANAAASDVKIDVTDDNSSDIQSGQANYFNQQTSSIRKPLTQSTRTGSSGFFTVIAKKKGGYVRSAQVYAASVIGIHCSAMGALLLVATSAVGETKPVYLMGYLNAILFAHRSGFRMRFIYATHTTIIVTIGFLIATAISNPDQLVPYSVYNLIVLVLGMMISYEEESLRRVFFILKSIRLLEFDQWFTVVLKIQGWVLQRIKNRANKARDNIRERKDGTFPTTHIISDTSGHMTQASKYGALTQVVNAFIAGISEAAA